MANSHMPSDPHYMANRRHAILHKTLGYIATMTTGYFGCEGQTVIEFYIAEKYHAEMMSNVMQLLNTMSTHDYELHAADRFDVLYTLRPVEEPFHYPRNIVPPC